MKNSKSVQTPMAQHFKLSLNDSHENEKKVQYMDNIPCENVLGSLMYVMICTHPSLVSRYMSKPGWNQWEGVKWIFRYRRETIGLRLLYGNIKESIDAIEAMYMHIMLGVWNKEIIEWLCV